MILVAAWLWILPSRLCYPCSFSLCCRSRFTFVSWFFVFAILAVSRCIVALDSLSSLDSLFICVDLCFLLSCGCHQGTFFTRVLLVTCNLVLALLSFRQSAVFLWGAVLLCTPLLSSTDFVLLVVLYIVVILSLISALACFLSFIN